MGAVGEAWSRATVELGAKHADAPGSDELEARYQEPHRRYHTLVHIECVLRDSGWLANAVGLDNRSKSILVLAVCAHDVIYTGAPVEDEQASADWATSRLTDAGVDVQATDQVSKAVLATISHEVDPLDLLVACLLDADLAILGSPADVYDRYAKDVRGEYDRFDDATWKLGRSHVLEQMKKRSRLFLTEPGRERWESDARVNLDRELRSLEPDTGTIGNQRHGRHGIR